MPIVKYLSLSAPGSFIQSKLARLPLAKCNITAKVVSLASHHAFVKQVVKATSLGPSITLGISKYSNGIPPGIACLPTDAVVAPFDGVLRQASLNLPNGSGQRGFKHFRNVLASQGNKATQSISTRAPLGRAATCTQARAGATPWLNSWA
ncbi:MAG: hypothetical protein RLZZ158_1953 [Cyanobacteriota bacterium]